MTMFFDALAQTVGADNVLKNEPMSSHTTFRIGGPADYYVTPGSPDEVIKILDLCKKSDMPFYIVGNGSNLLVKDEGFRGLIIEMGSRFSTVSINEYRVTAGAGAKLGQVAKTAMENGLAGMEFAHGIPGTVGGAVVMNAGAYGGEIKDIIVEATVLDDDGNIYVLSKEALELGYRQSIISKKNYIVLEAVFELLPDDPAWIKGRMDELASKRREKQPLEYPSAGSTFKRPLNGFAAKLIEDSGLKGYSVGGAQVSEKHSGFVINKGGATAEDVLKLIDHIRDTVERDSGIRLETEVKIVG